MGSMSIFGSYLEKDHKITGEALNVVILDTLIAIIAGIIIIPSCFAYGIQPDAGPSLLFITLPNVFRHMPGGRVWETLFFIFMTFAALSTVIAVFENIISCGMELTGWSRKKSSFVNAIAITLLSIPCVLGYNLWSWRISLSAITCFLWEALYIFYSVQADTDGDGRTLLQKPTRERGLRCRTGCEDILLTSFR